MLNMKSELKRLKKIIIFTDKRLSVLLTVLPPNNVKNIDKNSVL